MDVRQTATHPLCFENWQATSNEMNALQSCSVLFRALEAPLWSRCPPKSKKPSSRPPKPRCGPGTWSGAKSRASPSSSVRCCANSVSSQSSWRRRKGERGRGNLYARCRSGSHTQARRAATSDLECAFLPNRRMAGVTKGGDRLRHRFCRQGFSEELQEVHWSPPRRSRSASWLTTQKMGKNKLTCRIAAARRPSPGSTRSANMSVTMNANPPPPSSTSQYEKVVSFFTGQPLGKSTRIASPLHAASKRFDGACYYSVFEAASGIADFGYCTPVCNCGAECDEQGTTCYDLVGIDPMDPGKSNGVGLCFSEDPQSTDPRVESCN